MPIYNDRWIRLCRFQFDKNKNTLDCVSNLQKYNNRFYSLTD